MCKQEDAGFVNQPVGAGTIHGARQAETDRAGVYVRSQREEAMKALHHTANLMESQARGARRLALLIAAMPEHDTDLFAVIGALLPGTVKR